MSLLSIFTSVVTATQMLIPMPQQVDMGNGQFDLNGPYRVENAIGNEGHNIYLQDIIDRHQDGARRVCILKQENAVPEAYRLHITADTLLIAAGDAVGFIRAGQTIAQLRQAGANGLPACDISDAPKFSWRGCMIDLSRHYFDMDCLKRQVDLMADIKLNCLHLHLTDAGGWRLQIERYPLLTQIAAWRTYNDWDEWWTSKDRRFIDMRKPENACKQQGYGYFYTKNEMRELIAYANERGVTIIPEIELPGHSEEILAVYPELACESDTGALKQTLDGPEIRGLNSGDLCPSNDKTFEFLCNVLDEVMELFPSKYIHIGGDEANMTAWKTCQRCQDHLKQLGSDKVAALQADLIQRVNLYLNEHGHKLIGWDEIIADGNPAHPAKTAMIWREAEYAKRAIDNGYDVIMAPNSHCYVNRNQDAPTGSPMDWSYLPFDVVASFNPLAGLSPQQYNRVLGIEACLWTEHVVNDSSVENHLYPRLYAISEVAWRGKAQDGLRARAQDATVKLIDDGIRAFDLRHEVGERPESKVIIDHLAKGATVTYLKPYNRYYVAQKEATLTDGQLGGWQHNDKRWQGFIGDSCVYVTVDLGKKTAIGSVSMEFMQNAGPDIYLPAVWTVECSNDGKRWRELYRQTSEKDLRRGISYHDWQWTGKKKVKARYLRIMASSHDHRSWIFTDEIVVK